MHGVGLANGITIMPSLMKFGPLIRTLKKRGTQTHTHTHTGNIVILKYVGCQLYCHGNNRVTNSLQFISQEGLVIKAIRGEYVKGCADRRRDRLNDEHRDIYRGLVTRP
jgi:hypothetical protein